jgi:hypothetical protein
MDFKFQVDDVEYEVGDLTMNDAMMIDREFGVRDLTEFQWTRPAYLGALVYLGMRRKHPGKTHAELMADVGAVNVQKLAEDIGDRLRAALEEAAKEVDPPKPSPKPRGKAVRAGS